MHYSVGAGSTPLHYAACGGNMKCCQVGFYSIKWISEAWNFCFVWNDYFLVSTDPSCKRCQSDDSKLQWVIQTECFLYCRVFEWFVWLLFLFACLMEISNGLCDYCLLFVCLMEISTVSQVASSWCRQDVGASLAGAIAGTKFWLHCSAVSSF